MKLLFVIPCGNKIPSGVVRVLQYLPLYESIGVSYKTINWHAPLQIKILSHLDQTVWNKSLHYRIIRLIGYKLSSIIKILHTALITIFLIFRCKKYDAIYFQWILPSKQIVTRLKNSGVPIIYDFDDATFLHDPERANHILSLAWAVLAGNNYNFEYAKQYNLNSYLLPSSVNTELFKPTTFKPKRKVITIGWIGSPSTFSYLKILTKPLNRLLNDKYIFELLVAGVKKIDTSFLDQKIVVKYIETYTANELPSICNKIDIGIMPLPNSNFVRGKCAMKALIYGAAKIPCISSNVGEIQNIIEDGYSGFLASNSEDWYIKLKLLIDNDALRFKLSENLFNVIQDKYSLKKTFKILSDLMSELKRYNLTNKGHQLFISCDNKLL